MDLGEYLLGALDNAASRIGGVLGGIGEGAGVLVGNVIDAGRGALFGEKQVALARSDASDTVTSNGVEAHAADTHIAAAVTVQAPSLTDILSDHTKEISDLAKSAFQSMMKTEGAIALTSTTDIQAPMVGGGRSNAVAQSSPALGGQATATGGFSQPNVMT